MKINIFLFSYYSIGVFQYGFSHWSSSIVLCSQQHQCTSAVVNTSPKQLKNNFKQPRRIDEIHNYNAKPRKRRKKKVARASTFSRCLKNMQRLQCRRKQIRFNDKKHVEIVQSLISFSSSGSQISGRCYFVLVLLIFFFSTTETQIQLKD